MRFPTLRFVLRSIRPARVEFINSALARVLNTGFDVLLPLLFALVVDEVISRQRLTLLPGLALIFAIILVGTQFLFLVSLWCWASVRNEFNASLREQAFDHLLHVAAGALDRERTADLARTINTDASRHAGGYALRAHAYVYQLRTVRGCGSHLGGDGAPGRSADAGGNPGGNVREPSPGALGAALRRAAAGGTGAGLELDPRDARRSCRCPAHRRRGSPTAPPS